MWNRKELKMRGKAAFKANYWRCVLVALILMVVAGGIGAAGGRVSSQSIQDSLQEDSVSVTAEQSVDSTTGDEDLDSLLADLDQLSNGQKAAIAAGVIAILFIFIAIAAVISILLLNPIIVGCQRFFSENSRQPAELKEVAYGFEGGYGRVVKTMFLKDLFIVLWCLLFIIPGIIKSYSYRMVPYILAQEPELSGREVINRSREMMNGNKWRAFVLDLSFILWLILSFITLNIVGIFYVYPYIEATNAELYHALKGQGPLQRNDSPVW